VNYFDHADARGLDVRRLAAASKADRARMLATLAERELGCITITMSAAELRARLAEAEVMAYAAHKAAARQLIRAWVRRQHVAWEERYCRQLEQRTRK